MATPATDGSAHLLAQREPHYIQIAPFRGNGDDDHFPDNDYDDD